MMKEGNVAQHLDDGRQDEEEEHQLHHIETLSQWSFLTTRLLKDGGSGSWHVLDGVLEGIQAGSAQQLWKELEKGDFLKELRPGRTNPKVNMEEPLSLLSSLQSSAPGISALIELSTTGIDPSPPRGDRSTFITKKCVKKAPTQRDNKTTYQYPQLHLLVSSVSNTVQQKLSAYIDFDFNRSSVQLAQYPGDSKSGYVRHCDRGHSQCSMENTETSPSPSTDTAVPAGQRIITAIYYLTPEDWDSTFDGGSLRLFQTDDTSSPQPDKFVNICPYRDRLVVFRSDCVEHQVLPSHRRRRTAITIWFYGALKEAPISAANNIRSPQRRQLNMSPTVGSTRSVTDSHQSSHSSADKSSETYSPPLSLHLNGTDKKSKLIENSTIFVSIASYRDSETVPTLHSLFERSQFPDRIYVGLVLQLVSGNKEDDKIWNDVTALPDYPAQIRCLRLEAEHASGPTYARYLAQSLWHDEAFFLQIDSHMRFRGNWDCYLIDQHRRLVNKGNQNVVLSTYPYGYQLPNKVPKETRGTVLVPWKFDTNGMLRMKSRLLEKETALTNGGPVHTHLYAGGFNFSSSSIISDVPYDPKLPHLFFGEEISMTIRLFTSGYDIYAPLETVCYHLWSRAHRPVFKSDNASVPTNANDNSSKQHEGLQAQSIAKVQRQCRGESVGEAYGLGRLRTLAELGTLLRVDFMKKTLEDGCENGALGPAAFVECAPAAALERKLDVLESKPRNLIASFLTG